MKTVAASLAALVLAFAPMAHAGGALDLLLGTTGTGSTPGGGQPHYLTTPGAGTLSCPVALFYKIEVIGGGGGGQQYYNGGAPSVSGQAGNGGNYAVTYNVPCIGSVSYSVGAAGAAGAYNGNGGNGGDTFFGATTFAAATVAAHGGLGGISSGPQSQPTDCIGALCNTGGVGGAGYLGASPSGGAGAAGPSGNGGAGGVGYGSGNGSGGGGADGGYAGSGSSGGGAGNGGNNNFNVGGGGGGGAYSSGGAGSNGGGGGGGGAVGGFSGQGSTEPLWDSTHGPGSGGGATAYQGNRCPNDLGSGALYGGGGSTTTSAYGITSCPGSGAQGIITLTY